jgi:hypothetical protein
VERGKWKEERGKWKEESGKRIVKKIQGEENSSLFALLFSLFLLPLHPQNEKSA